MRGCEIEVLCGCLVEAVGEVGVVALYLAECVVAGGGDCCEQPLDDVALVMFEVLADEKAVVEARANELVGDRCSSESKQQPINRLVS